MWFAGLPAAFCGWMLEAVKQAGDNPPALDGAGYNLVRTAKRNKRLSADAPVRFIRAGAFLLFPRRSSAVFQQARLIFL